MEDLNMEDVAMVSGGSSIYGDFAYALGKFIGGVAAANQKIDSFDNPMLGAMQYGA